MPVPAGGGFSLCLVVIAAYLLPSASGQPPECYYSEIKGYKGLYFDQHSGKPRPCARGTIFDPALCVCIHGANNDKKCHFKAVADDPTSYRDTRTQKILYCARGQVYNSLLCKCKIKKQRKTCTPRFSLDFNANVLKNKIIRYNVGGGDSLGLNRGHGNFSKDSRVIFWTFSNRPYEEDFQVQMSFRDDPTSKQKTQVLLSNCNAQDHPDVPSVLIYLDKTKQNPKSRDLLRVHYRTYQMPQGVEVKVPFKSGQTNIIVVLKARDTLKVRIIYQNGKERLSSNKLVGQIVTSDNSLCLGSCPGQFNGFSGDMDWFDYFPCWPRQRS